MNERSPQKSPQLNVVCFRFHHPARIRCRIPSSEGSGEPVEHKGTPTKRFRGQLIYFTNADVTIRRTSGAILVVDNYEIVAISDGKTRMEPR